MDTQKTDELINFVKCQERLLKHLLLAFTIVMMFALTGCKNYTVDKIEHTFPSLVDNPLGDSSTRVVHILLPPDYDDPDNATKRYPSVYVLHGFGASPQSIDRISKIVEGTLESWFTGWRIKDMIVVIPHAGTSLCDLRLACGSFYRNSEGTGNYKGYILDDLIDFIDSHYRTEPDRAKRGISGFSMGGYGSVMLAMESNVESNSRGLFSSVASHSGLLSLEHFLDELANPSDFTMDWVNNRVLPALTAAFSPGLDLELEYNDETGEITKNDSVWALWLENDPLTFLKGHTNGVNPFTETAVYIDCGVDDELGLKDHVEAFVQELNNLAIEHQSDIYEYDTGSEIFDEIVNGHLLIEFRIGESLKFHSKNFYAD
ncbi:hypothetical protein GWO43_05090 [candidate division KSB1 bacterium]|nr:hypothetical protein [candidate division KSB1 bacterium]NIR71459.1 hypothetical protein [candidate division KSB1 bacterium]NIS23380.1 hypothetical protein [candidate division KSB1 bacterium]NIT70271.1 hypothetical protein [candidate division KSB1 bacterium]NIU23994.1 hypothetical protein [candidate division KSB1 bacterium]